MALIGDPWTAVLADRLSAVAIVDAVRAGRVLVSRGPLLDVTTEVGGLLGEMLAGAGGSAGQHAAPVSR